MAIRGGAKVPECFNWALLVLIAKDREKYTAKGLPTPPEELRPISLGNTDAKHSSASLARPLVLVADSLISKTQGVR